MLWSPFFVFHAELARFLKTQPKSPAVGMCLNSTLETDQPHYNSEKGEADDMKGARMCSLACDSLSKAFILDRNLGSRTRIRKYQALTVLPLTVLEYHVGR